MSEYQYYEFAAVDQPLTKAQMSRLRALSTRARITPRRFTNTYNWGDFKGDPDRLMEEFFDAHLYTSNFGYRKLCLRVPSVALDPAALQDYLVDDCLETRKTRGNLILKFTLNTEGEGWNDDYDWDGSDREGKHYDPYDEDDYDEDLEDYGDGDDYDATVIDADDNNDSIGAVQRSLDALLPLRDELMRGDLRALYIGWLGAMQNRRFDDDDGETEPPVPPGLGTLTPAQQTLALFLQIDTSLLEAAAEKSAPLKPVSKTAQRQHEQEAMRAWLSALSPAQKDTWLERLATTSSGAADGADIPMTIAAEARRDFLTTLRKTKHEPPAGVPPADANSAAPSSAPAAAPRRTTQALLRRMKEIETARKQREAEAAARAAAELARQAAAAREKHLDRQAAREHELWPAVREHISTRLPAEYDQAVALLLDLRDLARRRGRDAQVAFITQLCEFKDAWKSRPGLLRRIDAAFAKTDAAQQEKQKEQA